MNNKELNVIEIEEKIFVLIDKYKSTSGSEQEKIYKEFLCLYDERQRLINNQ